MCPLEKHLFLVLACCMRTVRDESMPKTFKSMNPQAWRLSCNSKRMDLGFVFDLPALHFMRYLNVKGSLLYSPMKG